MPGIRLAAGGTAKGLTPAGFFDLVDPTLTWTDLERLIEELDLPVLVKGVHTAQDARLAVSTAPRASSSPTTAAASSTASPPASTCSRRS